MKQFLTKIFIFTVFLFAIDKLFYNMLLEQRPADYKSYIEEKQRFFNQEKHYDVLIIGDSHIADGVDTRTLNNCGFTAFNLGLYHSSPYEWYYTLVHALNTLPSPPSMVIVGTNPVMFNRRNSKGKYTPLVINDPILGFSLAFNSKEGIEAGSFFNSVQEQYLIPKDSGGFPDFKSWFFGKEPNPRRIIKSIFNGHLEFYNQLPAQWEGYSGKAGLWGWPNEPQVEHFNAVLELLKSKNIKTVVVNTPIWSNLLNYYIENRPRWESFDKTLNESCTLYGVPIFNQDYSLLQNELSKNDYLNTVHLSYPGSVKFTTELCDFLKKQ